MGANTVAVIEAQQRAKDANTFDTLFKNPYRWSSNGVVTTTEGPADSRQYQYSIWDAVRSGGAWEAELKALGIEPTTGSWMTGDSLHINSSISTYMKYSGGYLYNSTYDSASDTSTLDPDLNNAINFQDLFLLANNIVWARDNTIGLLYWTDFVSGTTQKPNEVLWEYHPALANTFST